MASDFEARLEKATEDFVEAHMHESYSASSRLIARLYYAAGAKWAFKEGRKAGLEEAAKRCEREAEALRQHEAGAGYAMKIQATSLASWIRALLDKKPGKEGA